MLLVELMLALGVALLVTAIFAAGLHIRPVWPNWLIAFGLVLLAAWAGGVWIRPVGPAIGGVTWMPFLFLGLVMALLLAAVMRGQGRFGRRRTGPGQDAETEITFSVFVWVLAVGLAVAILLAYAS